VIISYSPIEKSTGNLLSPLMRNPLSVLFKVGMDNSII